MRYIIVLRVVLITLVSISVAEAQSPQPNPQALPLPAQQDLQQYYGRVLQQFQGAVRGGGGRGAPPGGELIPRIQLRYALDAGAWWTNADLVTKLGLTDDQKARIQRAYENHRQNLTTDSAELNKQETQLATLIAADPIDHNAVLSQIDRVAQARADLERTNAAMTLEMREVLTAAQWMQLQPSPLWLAKDLTVRRLYFPSPGAAGGPGQRNGGQRSGQRQQ
jgi:hypothetical protein